MSGLQQAPQFPFRRSIYLESNKFLPAAHAGTVVANPVFRKAMVAGCILKAEGHSP
jgi:hypothetical protein